MNPWVVGAIVLLFSEEVFAMLGIKNRSGLSSLGLGFIIWREGLPLNKAKTHAIPYNDSAGHCTIGIGHLLHEGRCNGSESAITKEEAIDLFETDIAKFARGVQSRVRVPLAQHELDALTSFAFNIGLGAFEKSTLLKRLNTGDKASVPMEMMRWVKETRNGVLVVAENKIQRRRMEGEIFARGVYPPEASKYAV